MTQSNIVLVPQPIAIWSTMRQSMKTPCGDLLVDVTDIAKNPTHFSFSNLLVSAFRQTLCHLQKRESDYLELSRSVSMKSFHASTTCSTDFPASTMTATRMKINATNMKSENARPPKQKVKIRTYVCAEAASAAAFWAYAF